MLAKGLPEAPMELANDVSGDYEMYKTPAVVILWPLSKKIVGLRMHTKFILAVNQIMVVIVNILSYSNNTQLRWHLDP